MDDNLEKKIEKKIEEMIPSLLERYKIYSKEDLLTREEFLESLQLMNKRFEAMDKRFELLQQLMDKRFEAVDKRFEALQELIDKRFEAVDKRFEAVDKRFEAVDKRFEALQHQMDTRFELMLQEMHYGFDKMHVILTSFGARSGVRLEKTIVNLARKALEERQIEITKIEYNRELIDDGTYFENGYRTHIDMYAHDSQHIFFDIKYQVNLHDMHDFIKRIKLAESFLKVKSSKNIIIALEISEDTKQEAERRKLEVISID